MDQRVRSGGSGANGNDYYLYGQGRWGFSPWDNPDRYHFESALTHAPKVTVPFLIMHGTADPTVSFSEGMNFYNALRYNGKTAHFLAYPNEGHGLRGMANRKDLTVRFFQFFDHYLKGAPAPKRVTGVSSKIRTPRSNSTRRIPRARRAGCTVAPTFRNSAIFSCFSRMPYWARRRCFSRRRTA